MPLRIQFGLSRRSASVRFRGAIAGGLAGYLLAFDDVVFDNHALPLRADRDSPWHLLIHVANGTIAWNDQPVDAGATFLLPEEGVLARGGMKRGPRLRTLSASTRIVALRVPSASVVTGGGALREAPWMWQDRATALEAALAGLCPTDLREAMTALWFGLSDAGVVVGGCPVSLEEVEPDPAQQRISLALSMALSQLEQNPQLVDLVAHAQVTERQLLRDILAMQSRFGFVLHGWRSTLLWWKLVAATLFLGCPRLRIREVADTVGFASTTTMARAFRRAGLATPTEVRHRMRDTLSAASHPEGHAASRLRTGAQPR